MSVTYADIVYVHPCLVCGEPTGSDDDAPATCLECAGHECDFSEWLADDPSRVFCSICEEEKS